jgi:hypothetical protein
MGHLEQQHRSRLGRLYVSEQGEGVISAAIAVLVMAFLGVAMWAAFNFIFDETQGTVHEQVREIGSD